MELWGGANVRVLRAGGSLSKGGAKVKPKGGSVVRASGRSVGGGAVGGAKVKVSLEGVARVPGWGYDGMWRSKAIVCLDRRVCKSVVPRGVSAKLNGLVRVELGRGWSLSEKGVVKWDFVGLGPGTEVMAGTSVRRCRVRSNRT